jgi:hypothetical protein
MNPASIDSISSRLESHRTVNLVCILSAKMRDTDAPHRNGLAAGILLAAASR